MMISKITKTIVIVSCFILAIVSKSYAQKTFISGFIRNTNDDPVVGASFTVKGMNKSAVSDSIGHYIISYLCSISRLITAAIRNVTASNQGFKIGFQERASSLGIWMIF